MQTMAPALDVDSIRTSVLPTVVLLSNDRIPNIRFNVAKAFEVLATSLGDQGPEGVELVESDVVEAVEKLRLDADADVRFFAEKAAETAHRVVNGGGNAATAATASTTTGTTTTTTGGVGAGDQAPQSEEVVMSDA